MSWTLEGRPVRSVLLTRLRYLGDIVMSTVLVDVLRRGDPELEIGYLCEDSHADVLEGHDGIDRVHRLGVERSGSDAKARTTGVPAARTSRSTLGTIRDLKDCRYDLAVDLFFNPRSAWLLRLAGIPQRIGGTRKWRGRLYSHRVLRSDFEAEHPVFHYLAPGGLGEHLCRLAPLRHAESGLDFPVWMEGAFNSGELRPRLGRPVDDPRAQDELNALGVQPAEPFLLLAPCATWESKEWPIERWSELISLLLAGQDLPLVVLTAPGKMADWEKLSGMIPQERGGVLPPMRLSAALDVIAKAKAFVTVDGGVMHAAVGLGVPTLALFGPTDPDIWFPYEGSGPFRVMARAPYCHPCDLHECSAFICLPELQPSEVMRGLTQLLDVPRTRGGGVHE